MLFRRAAGAVKGRGHASYHRSARGAPLQSRLMKNPFTEWRPPTQNRIGANLNPTTLSPAVRQTDVGPDDRSHTAITNCVHGLTRTGLAVLWAPHLMDEIHDDDQLLVSHHRRIAAQQSGYNLRGSGSLARRFITLTETKSRLR